MDQLLPAFEYQVEWGAARLGFTKVSGLELENEVIEYREGNFKVSSSIKLPGRKRYGDVTLERGIVLGDNDLFEWFEAVEIGTIDQEHRDVTISVLGADHQPIMSWKLVDAWIRKLVGPTLDAQGNAVAIETMVLACERIAIDNG